MNKRLASEMSLDLAIIEKRNEGAYFIMTPETMDAFIMYETNKGASANMLRRLQATVKTVYDYLPDDKQLTRERLLEWRADMDSQGYASQTVQNYVKYFNRYLDYVGMSDIRFNRGKGKDISGMQFGFLTAIEPTDKRDRRDVVWLCRCKCGNTVELAATRLLINNTLSCGCINRELIKRANKYFGGTSLEKSLKEQVTSTRSISGYVGVTRKRGKWQAYITYKRQHISLGVYDKLEDAVKARARGKEAVMQDAAGMLEIYNEIHKNDGALPSRATEPLRVVARGEKCIHDQPVSAAIRRDNTSGYTGIAFAKNKWEARICYNKIRYMLGRFDTRDEAIEARRAAEEMLRTDSEAFVEYYSRKCRQPVVLKS